MLWKINGQILYLIASDANVSKHAKYKKIDQEIERQKARELTNTTTIYRPIDNTAEQHNNVKKQQIMAQTKLRTRARNEIHRERF